MKQKLKQQKMAVAIHYAPDENEVPKLAAKGRGLIADKIIEKAMEHGVPVQENASLVEILSKLDLDQEIPPELYKVVAEILTFIYRSDRRAEESARL